MRSVYGSNRSYHVSCAALRNGPSDIQTSFGMGYNVDFFTSLFFNYISYTLCQLPSAVCYRSCRLLFSIINFRSVAHKLLRYPSPIARELIVSEEYAVNQENRIFRTTYLLFLPGRIQSEFFSLKNNFFGNSFYYLNEENYIKYGNHSKESSQNSRFNPQLYRCGIDSDYACPKKHKFRS